MLGTPVMHYEQEQKILEKFHAKAFQKYYTNGISQKNSAYIVNIKLRKRQSIDNNKKTNNTKF